MKANVYRFECWTCKKAGRWHRNGNGADADGERHLDRHPNCTNYDVVRREPAKEETR